MSGNKSIKRYEKKFLVEIETWVTSRKESGFVRHISDPEGKEWRACARHSNGVMEWEWFDDFDTAVAWCERFDNTKK